MEKKMQVVLEKYRVKKNVNPYLFMEKLSNFLKDDDVNTR